MLLVEQGPKGIDFEYQYTIVVSLDQQQAVIVPKDQQQPVVVTETKEEIRQPVVVQETKEEIRQPNPPVIEKVCSNIVRCERKESGEIGHCVLKTLVFF